MSETTPEQEDKAAIMIGLFSIDSPIPIRRLYGAVCSEASFKVWRNKGVIGTDGHLHKLPTIDIEGQGICVIPSELVKFQHKIGQAKN